tara:strand:+ start:72 stop:269 length:198 start_codon:yes stop_codon:yes gene_type:complete
MSQQREGYYDYMLRRSKEENSKGKSDILEQTIQEMQKEIHALQMSVKRLSDENHRLRQNANIHNN